MVHPSRQFDEPNYGERRAIEHLTAAADAMRGVIMHNVTDPDVRRAALQLVTEALGAALQGVATV